MKRNKSTLPTPKKANSQSGEWKENFLQALRNSGNVRLACQAAAVDRSTAYNHRRNDDKFAAAWKIALHEAVEALEAVAWKRAREQSDTLLIFLLKALKPKMYREKFTVEYDLAKELLKKMNELGLTEEEVKQNTILAPIFARAGIIPDSSIGNGVFGQA